MASATTGTADLRFDSDVTIDSSGAWLDTESWEQHVRRPRFQQVERLHWDKLLFTSFVYFPCLLPVIVSFEEFKTPAFTSAFTSPALAA